MAEKKPEPEEDVKLLAALLKPAKTEKKKET